MHVYKKFGKIGRQTNRQIGQLLSNYEMCSWLFKKKLTLKILQILNLCMDGHKTSKHKKV